MVVVVDDVDMDIEGAEFGSCLCCWCCKVNILVRQYSICLASGSLTEVDRMMMW